MNLEASCVIGVNLGTSCAICGVNLGTSNCVSIEFIVVYIGKAGRIEGITGLTDIGGTCPGPPSGVKPRLCDGTGTGTGTLTEGKTGRIDGKTGNTVLDGPMGVIDAGGHGGINGFEGAELGDSEGGHGGGEVSGIGGFGMLQCELDGTSVVTVALNEGNIAD